MLDKVLLVTYSVIFAIIGTIAGVGLPLYGLWLVTAVGAIPIGVVALVRVDARRSVAVPAAVLSAAWVIPMWGIYTWFFMNLSGLIR